MDVLWAGVYSSNVFYHWVNILAPTQKENPKPIEIAMQWQILNAEKAEDK